MADKTDKREELFEEALKGKKIPILTLDNKWHQLFTQTGTNSEIKELEKSVNEILKEDARVKEQIKDVKRLKKKLMDSMLQDSMEEDQANDKKVIEQKRLIEECNEKLDAYQDALLDIDPRLDEENRKLMLATMEVCYEHIKEDNAFIEEIGEWITKIRIELKKNLIKKQECEIRNNNLYSYMHDIFGPDVIELFDMKYNPENPPQKKKDNQ